MAQQGGLVTVVPRTCAIRQEVEAWGQPQRSLPLLLEQPGRRRQDTPRRWYGRSGTRQVEGEDADGRVALEPLRLVAVYSKQLAQHHAQASLPAPTHAAAALAQHSLPVEARRFACAADAATAVAEYAGHCQGRRGRRPCHWHSHTVHYQVQTEWRRKTRARRGRPAQAEQPAEALCYRRGAEATPLPPPVHTYGWLVLATTWRADTCGDAELVRAYRDQTTTVEPGCRWLKHPAAISPVWLEKPERIAALAMVTVVGFLVYALIQRQVRQYLQLHRQRIPGKKGETAIPTAAVVVASFSPVVMISLQLDDTAVRQVHGWQEHHAMICDALGVDCSWYEVAADQKNNPSGLRPP